MPGFTYCRICCAATDELKLSRDAHGPALTLQTTVTTRDGKTHPVSMDLAVMIRAGLEFLPEMGWPVRETSCSVSYICLPCSPWSVSYTVPVKSWPPQDKIDAILEKGINVVAKKQFFWQVSFVELEKELVGEIDKDGGCRKEVHRIMKSVFYNACKEKPVLTSYMLKVSNSIWIDINSMWRG